MTYADDTHDVEHILFSDLVSPTNRHRPAVAPAPPPGPLAIYAGCHPAARLRVPDCAGGEEGEGGDGEASTTGEEHDGEWGELTLELPAPRATLPWIWSNSDD